MTRNEAREYFKNHGLSYGDVTSGDICVLVMMLNSAIKKARKTGEMSYETLSLSERIKVKYNTNGTIKNCFLFVNSDNFTRRECISFNTDGFIGFAGWSDNTNVKPMIEAFVDWCKYLAGVNKEAVGC